MIKLTDILSEKIKPRQRISKKEWSKIKKFNKHIGQDGTHYVTQLDKKLGTILVPVIVEEKLTEKVTGQYKVSPKVEMHWGMDKVVIISGNKRVVLNRKEMKSLMKGVKANKLTEEKLTEKKQLYVVASTNGTLFSGDKGVTEKQALKIMDRYEKVGMNLFMLGVQYWNKPHKYNKKKIMVGEGKLTNEAIDLKDAGGEIFDTIIAFKKIYEKSPHKKNRKINMYIKQLLKIEQQISDVIGDLD